MANIKLSITRIPVIELWGLAGKVISSMTDNPYFPDPIVPTAALTMVVDKLRIQMLDANQGSRLAYIQRDSTVALLRDLLRQEADYVRAVCKGDAVMLGSSGFEMMRERSPIGQLPAPQALEASFTDLPGRVDLRWERVRGARSYRVWVLQSGTLADGEWRLVAVSTRARFNVTGLATARYHWFRVNAIGAAGEGGFSNVAKGMAA